MAYIVHGSSVSEITSGSTSSYTPSVFPSSSLYVNDDYIFAWVGQNGGTGVLSCATSGWVRHGTRTGNPAGLAYGQWFSAKVSGGTVATPTFASTVSDNCGSIMFIVRDADETTVLDVAGTQTDWNNVGNAGAGRPTATSSGCLVLHGWVSDGIVLFRSDLDDANMVTQIATSAIGIAVSFRQHETSTQVPAQTMYFNKATEGGTFDFANKGRRYF